MANSKYQRFTVETIQRSQIKNADYNPRVMGKEAKKRLKKNLQENGLVSAITWNRRTGNIVGGHQRIEQLDALERTQDYALDVCVIDVDERQEAKLNVLLNNQSQQGEFDLDGLAMLTEAFDLSFEEMGFTQLDVDFMYDGDERFTEMFESEEKDEAKGSLQAIKDFRAQSREQYKENNNTNWILAIVFPDEDAKAKFCKKISVARHERFITEEQIMRLEK